VLASSGVAVALGVLTNSAEALDRCVPNNCGVLGELSSVAGGGGVVGSTILSEKQQSHKLCMSNCMYHNAVSTNFNTQREFKVKT
jgi:hypothetical protein